MGTLKRLRATGITFADLITYLVHRTQLSQRPRSLAQVAVNYQSLDMLQEQGVAVNDIQKLNDAGYHTIESVAHATIRKLSEVRGLSEAKVVKLKDIVKQMVPMDFKTAADALEDRKSLVTLTTGSTELDKLLEGGVETGSLTEVFGEFRTGKTQLCHTLCVTCQMPVSDGGAEGKAIYIDTEGTFRPQRLQGIAERFGMDPAVALENVAYARAHNSEHQTELLKMAAAIMSQDRYASRHCLYRILTRNLTLCCLITKIRPHRRRLVSTLFVSFENLANDCMSGLIHRSDGAGGRLF